MSCTSNVPASFPDESAFLDPQGNWRCLGGACAACCQCIADVLPHLDRGDGTCQYLTHDGLCGIYERRPLLCRVLLFPATDQARAAACALVARRVYAPTQDGGREGS